MRKDEFAVPVLEAGKARQLVYSDWGPRDSGHLFVCLPGLLETRESFHGFAEIAGRHARVAMLDFCGRGDSDWLINPAQYSMRTYLSEVGLLLARLTAPATPAPRPHAGPPRGAGATGWSGLFRPLLGGQAQRSGKPADPETQSAAATDAHRTAHHDARPPVQRLHFVGTSMGGLLAAVAATSLDGMEGVEVASVTFNDVGPLLPWTGMMALMMGMSAAQAQSMDAATLASRLRVDPNLLRAVRQPGHLDIHHGTTLTGIDFTEWMGDIRARILLLHGAESELLNEPGVAAMREIQPSARVIDVPGCAHPVPYTPEICEAILRFALEAEAAPLPR